MSTDRAQKCVLVVDDSRFVRKTFASILRPSFVVREAADGEEAWAAIEADPSIVMVLTDLDMPKLSGFALIERIRSAAEGRIRELPVIVFSGNEEAGSKERARGAGAIDFIAKSADAPEVLARLDNVLRLVRTAKEATHDPVTGTLTPHYLLVEGRKHFAHARRHGGELSVMALRIDTHAEIVRAASKAVADVVLKRIAQLLMQKLRTEDSVARTGEAAFMVLAAGTSAPQMLALAQRLQRELDEAKVTYRGHKLRFAATFGVASLSLDPATSIEDLMRLAMQRLQGAAKAPQAPQSGPLTGLPAEVERALQVLEGLDPARLGSGARELARRLDGLAKMIQVKKH